MNTTGQNEEQTSPSLTDRLPAPVGAAPEPTEHAVCRITLRPDGSAATLYLVADEPPALSEAEWSAWLARRGLTGAERAAIAMLVIREALDASGEIRECTLERRRGGATGPLQGDPARVDFLGPARMARFYRVSRDGGLTEVPAATENLLPHRAPHLFNGEQPALRQHFGLAARVTDAREPTLFEQLVGLDSILRVRLPHGPEVACGIGWHGPVPFVLRADFPRFTAPLLLAPEDAAAVEALLARHELVRHETRLDAQGLAVIARRRGAAELFMLRSVSGAASVQPYQPAPDDVATPDQSRWLRFAETYEHLAVLDAWADADGDGLQVITGEANGQIWRHHIDGDGVETWRKPDDEAAAGLLYREQLTPGTLATIDAAPPEPAIDEPGADFIDAPAADSLLARLEAHRAAMTALQGARQCIAGDPAQATSGLVTQFRQLLPALDLLGASHTAAEARRMLWQVEARQIRPARLAAPLARLETRLRDELGTVLLVAPPPAGWRPPGEAMPFGEAVELAFPQVSYDVEEAALCLSFRRSSAAVFHCMRIVECGLAALRIDAAEEERDWARIIARLRHTAGGGREALVTSLTDVRRYWRGPRLLPADKYTETEAERLFGAVGAFMRNLAEALPRDGAGV